MANEGRKRKAALSHGGKVAQASCFPHRAARGSPGRGSWLAPEGTIHGFNEGVVVIFRTCLQKCHSSTFCSIPLVTQSSLTTNTISYVVMHCYAMTLLHTYQLKANTYLLCAVSVGQESTSIFVGWFWLMVSPEVTFKLSPGATVIWCLTGAEEPASSLLCLLVSCSFLPVGLSTVCPNVHALW